MLSFLDSSHACKLWQQHKLPYLCINNLASTDTNYHSFNTPQKLCLDLHSFIYVVIMTLFLQCIVLFRLFLVFVSGFISSSPFIVEVGPCEKTLSLCYIVPYKEPLMQLVQLFVCVWLFLLIRKSKMELDRESPRQHRQKEDNSLFNNIFKTSGTELMATYFSSQTTYPSMCFVYCNGDSIVYLIEIHWTNHNVR